MVMFTGERKTVQSKISNIDQGDIYNQNKLAKIDSIILYLLVGLLSIRWFPGVGPSVFINFQKILMIIFITIQIIKVVSSGHIFVPWPSVTFAGVIVAMWILAYAYFTKALIVAFGISSIVYFIQNNRRIKTIFGIFTISMISVSLYSLIVTFTPLSGFEISAPIFSGYTNPADLFSHPRIQQNSFGFYGERGIYTLVSIAFVFSSIFAIRGSSKLYSLGAVVLVIQLINIWWLTGSSRAGFVLPIFMFVILVTRRVGLENLVPIFVFSPLIFWISLFIADVYVNINAIVATLDEFTSGRLSIYFESIEAIINNYRSLIGWGPGPWGEYLLSDLGVEPRSEIDDPRLTRPHNTLLEFLLQYGLIVGSLLVYICWQVAKKAAQEAKNPTSPSHFSLVIVLAGSFFVGIAVGGKTGPYTITDEVMIIWWLGLGALIGSHIPQGSVPHDMLD